jgi:predicted nucleotidyltransferase
MKVASPVLAPLLRSDTQGRILAEVFVDPEREHSVTSLANHAGTSLPTALRELDRAEAAKIVTSRRVGNTRLIKANPSNPLYPALREIILATYGPPAVVLEELGRLSGIEHLYLFGSWAARYQGEAGHAPNDIDVLVIGAPDRDQVYEAGERVEKRLRLPVQVTIRTAEQWARPDDPFLAEVRRRPLVSLLDEAGL